MIEDKKLKKFYNGLPPRKREVVELTCRGFSNEEIARRMVIESSTVAYSLTQIYARMGLLDEFAHLKPNRPILISVFAPFFERHPDLRNDEDDLSAPT